MREIEIPIKVGDGGHEIENCIEFAIAGAGLRITLRTTLKKFPGCVHWHVKNGRLAGTLEITYWAKYRRAWFTIQDGRKAEWINDLIPSLTKKMVRLTH